METNFSLNFTNPNFIQNPYKYYEELYTNDSILFDTHAKTWLAFNYDDVKAVLENKSLPKKLNFDFTEEEFVKAHKTEYMLRQGSLSYSNNEVIFITD